MIHFLNRLVSLIPLLNRDGSDQSRIIGNFLIGVFVIMGVSLAVGYESKLIAIRAAAAREKLIFARMLEDNQNMFTGLAKNYAELKPIFPALSEALLKEEDILLFSDALDKFSKESGNQMSFQFDTQNPTPETAFPDVARVHFNATLNGSQDSFTQFLKGLSHFRYFMSIDQMTIENSESSTAQSKMSMNGVVFIQKKL